jgi:hypothetical protein
MTLKTLADVRKLSDATGQERPNEAQQLKFQIDLWKTSS